MLAATPPLLALKLRACTGDVWPTSSPASWLLMLLLLLLLTRASGNAKDVLLLPVPLLLLLLLLPAPSAPRRLFRPAASPLRPLLLHAWLLALLRC